ncbi:MAG: hypothetical protein A2X49_05630 [Lentisphaerae bacterium GWF2_52_8]|nr:MAG: hypothetical protein A2X49_05630 [Lentisphaerae bacterium GWF2_52_8]
MKNPYPLNSYDTPVSYPRFRSDRFFLGCRLSFYVRIFYIWFKCSRLIRKGIFNRDRRTAYANLCIKTAEGCGGRFHLRGLDNLNAAGQPVVLIGNHMSMLETPILPGIVQPRINDVTFVVKKSLFKMTFLGEILKLMDAIGVSRENAREDFRVIMEEGKKRLSQGKSVIVFPQSTRMETFDPEQFNTVGIKLAKAAGVPVVPFALKTDLIGNGYPKFIKDFGPIQRNREVYIEFAPPIRISGNGKEEHQKIVKFIQERLNTWRAAEKR